MTLLQYVITCTDIESNKKFYITDLETMAFDSNVDNAHIFKSKVEAEQTANNLTSDRFDFGVEPVYKVILNLDDLDKLETL